jgi:hypothetical protein
MRWWTGDRIPMAGDAVDRMSRRSFLRKAGDTVAVASVGMSAAGVGLLASRRADAATVQRPLSDFLSTQGTFCVPDGMGGCLLLFPPVPLYLGWGSVASPAVAWVDYAGLANRSAGGAFGTQSSGTVTERALSDGRAQVDVTLHTTHALTFVTAFPPERPNPPAPLLFGHYAPDVLDGQDGAFGSSSFQLSFINPAPGAPLPDFLQLFLFPASGQETVVIAFQATAQGTLRSAFGVPDGTPGILTVAQTANVPKRSNIQASVVNLRPIGG